ncbi:MAG: hypothetical protein ACR2IE_03550 [Candidatus Sumerlaeaceae bacterium]
MSYGEQVKLRCVVIPNGMSKAARDYINDQNGLVGLCDSYVDILPGFLNSVDEVPDVLFELDGLLHLMLASYQVYFWQLCHLEESAEWRLVRRLSKFALNGLGWSEGTPDEDVLATLTAIS